MSLIQMDKQTPVSLPQICAPRAELMGTFDEAAKNQYIFVHAPAGYGKTISALLWLRRTERTPVWISLDAYDNAPVLFYRLFAMSLLSAIPHDPLLLQKVKSADFGADPVENTIDLLTRLDYGGRYTIVLDDFHLITSEEIVKSLPYVLKRLPVDVTVLVLSRNSLPSQFEALLQQGKLSVIGGAALTFSRDEIKRHFAGYGRFITRDEAEKIRDVTEGWVIALNAIAASGDIDMASGSPSRSLGNYIEKNIWQKLSREMQDFLLETSVPDKFSLELCRHLTEDPACAEKLDALMSGSIAVTKMGADYRYHNLILEFLRDRLKESTLDMAALNRRVAEYYLRQGDFLTAKTYAMKSRDPAIIAQTVRSFYSLKAFALDEYIEFHKLYGIHDIPEFICEKSPILYVPRIFFAYATGDAAGVSRYFDKLYPLIPRIAETNPEVLEHVNSMIMLDPRLKLSDLPKRAETLPPITHESGDLQSPTFTLQLPFLHRCVRDFYELEDSALRRDISAFSKPIIKENVGHMFEGARAGLMLEKNRIAEAFELAQLQKKTITGDMSAEFVYAVYVMAAETSRLSGRRGDCEAALREVKEYIARGSCQYLLKNLAAYEARIKIEDGDRASAETWLQNYYVSDSSFKELYKIYRSLTTARAFILLGLFDKALTALHELKALAGSFDRPLDAAEADVLLSVAEWSSGKKKEARLRLISTLRALRPQGYIRVAAGEGKAVLPVLTAAVRQLESEGDDGGLLMFAREVWAAACQEARRFKGLTYRFDEKTKPVTLSPQQKHVLALLAKGYTNADIVRETSRSLNTIRTHTKLAYQKLDVRSADDAVARARELGLIK